ncbi:hypothetical protein HW115_02930 [Verrucomicrobiaceae bacterium N1E253]|uniref:Glycoside hydrolase family 5 domain-containing protein n=1 Tax=Oceaniferula marina TaxID=2748318 RepID=A0A851GBJ9_9BACT|nr:hypothetical protein [Oceaniferula marina]NWK54549.1 hypothetical protein [Oceaniferula marina]
MKKIVLGMAAGMAVLVPCLAKPLDFNQPIVGVEQKAAKEDQGIHEVPDLFYGIAAKEYVVRLKDMGVNMITVPISREGQDPLVAFLKGIKDEQGDRFLSIVISHRKWSLDRESQRESWATAVAKTYNAIDDAGLGGMVKACRFDENDPLRGKASTADQWQVHFDAILDAMDRLNQKTNNAFKSKTVLMHGEGLGANFKGVHKAHVQSGFDQKMRERCINYGFTFKLFDQGEPPNGKSSDIREWEQHFRGHCGLDELSQLNQPVLFVGNAGDGLFPRSLDKEFKLRGANQWYFAPRALLKIFKEYQWSHFAFGPFLVKSDKGGRTYLHTVENGKIVERSEQLEDWKRWKDAVSKPSLP